VANGRERLRESRQSLSVPLGQLRLTTGRPQRAIENIQRGACGGG
jgi:hypothetical protein